MSDTLTRKQKQRLRKLKKKVYKLNYLNEELEDVVQTVSEHLQEFREAITKWFTQNNIENGVSDMFPVLTECEVLENVNEDDLETKPKNAKIDPWVREIYRQIAHMTHPDKLSQQSDLGTAERSMLEKTFITANTHLEENDGPSLYILAINLRLKVPNIPDNILEHFDKTLNDLSEKIDKNKNSHEWYWAESSFPEKIKFIENINKKYDIVTKEEEIALFLSDYTR
jgi:hypothetical protein